MATCTRCGAPINFVRNKNRKMVPTDVNTGRNHFTTCGNKPSNRRDLDPARSRDTQPQQGRLL